MTWGESTILPPPYPPSYLHTAARARVRAEATSVATASPTSRDAPCSFPSPNTRSAAAVAYRVAQRLSVNFEKPF